MTLTYVTTIEVEEEVKELVEGLYTRLSILKGNSEDLEVDRLSAEYLLGKFGADYFLSETYAKVSKNTMMSLPWLTDLYVMVEYVSTLTSGSLLEVGAWRGGSGGLMALQARNLSVLDPIYICDTFKGVVKAGEEDTVYTGGEHFDTSLRTVQSLIYDKLGLDKDVRILKGIFPDDTGEMIPQEEKFRFCHIDVDVYESAKGVLEWVWPRMVLGGVVLYDDYGHGITPGVRKHVDEHSEDKDKVIFTSPYMRAIMVKLEG